MLEEKAIRDELANANKKFEHYINAKAKEKHHSEGWWTARVHEAYWIGWTHALELVLGGK
jgi:hypothetical protein